MIFFFLFYIRLHFRAVISDHMAQVNMLIGYIATYCRVLKALGLLSVWNTTGKETLVVYYYTRVTFIQVLVLVLLLLLLFLSRKWYTYFSTYVLLHTLIDKIQKYISVMAVSKVMKMYGMYGIIPRVML